jgi:heat shock protein HslJ
LHALRALHLLLTTKGAAHRKRATVNYTSWLVLTLVSGLLAACVFPLTPMPEHGAAGAGADVAGLAGTGWLLTSLNGQDAPAEPAISLTFDAEGRVSGSDGCNRYNGQATIEDTTLTFGLLASTRRACPGPIMEQARAYQTALSQTTSFALAEEQLTLLDADGQPLAVFAAYSTDLAGAVWTVLAYNNGQGGVVSVLGGTTLTAEFNTQGQVAGSAGCNQYSAGYERDGSSALTISVGTSTMMACAEPAGIMEQEAQFLQALTTVATYRMDGNQLELRTAEGAIAVQLRKEASN